MSPSILIQISTKLSTAPSNSWDFTLNPTLELSFTTLQDYLWLSFLKVGDFHHYKTSFVGYSSCKSTHSWCGIQFNWWKIGLSREALNEIFVQYGSCDLVLELNCWKRFIKWCPVYYGLLRIGLVGANNLGVRWYFWRWIPSVWQEV